MNRSTDDIRLYQELNEDRPQKKPRVQVSNPSTSPLIWNPDVVHYSILGFSSREW